MTDSVFRPLETSADWEDALDRSDDTAILVFKHSSSCSISGSANEEMKTLAAEEDVPVYRVVVQESRDVSDTIEDTLNVRHETPQAILVQDGRAVFDTSHLNVTADTLRTEWHRAPAA